MDTTFTSLIDSAKSVLILLPTKPYFDQVAAALSLYLSLEERREIGISIASSAPITVGFNRLIGVNKIVSEIGNKNLTIRFQGYDANNIEKVSYDIENGEFRLTVVPKVGFVAPQKEELNLSYSGTSADLVVLVGGASDSHFPLLAKEELKDAKVVHIGTRVLNVSRDVMSLAKPGSSTSELVANIIKNEGLTIDADIATNLVMGIEEGSNNFSSMDVTPETFETFAYLLRSGGVRTPKVGLNPANFPAGSIPTQPFGGRPSRTSQALQAEDFEASDIDSTQETEQEINPPDDWLQPKVYKGSSNQPDSFSENKG